MKYLFQLFLAAALFSSCTVQKNNSRDNGKIEIDFLQINDVYEIAPLSGGKEGGMARVATLKKKYKAKNPNTFLVMSGDFISPSVYNSLQYQGKAIRGKQMIEAMNAAGVDLVVFGNHEFDIRENELQDRIDESVFQWISSNTFHKIKDQVLPFSKNGSAPFPTTYILNVTDADGTTAKLGFIGLCLPFNKADYVYYTDALSTAKELYNQLKDSVDAVIAITHQSMEEDELLAREIPGLAMILGGHEHDQRYNKLGNVEITKAMANAKSAYAIHLKINKKRNKFSASSALEIINDKIQLDSQTNAVVEKWVDIAEKNYSTLGFDAGKVVVSKGEPLDGRELMVRTTPTNLTMLITAAIAEASPQSRAVIINAGSIRVDDIIQIPVTQYDILRTLPFGGGIQEADIRGSLLTKVLDQGEKNKGIGGYLLFNEAISKNTDGDWLMNGKVIEAGEIYRIAFAEFLLSGKEANLDFLNPANADVVKVYPIDKSIDNPRSDVRLAVVRYLEKRN